MSAPWWPMVAPPLPALNDAEYDTCEHGFPREECEWMARLAKWGYSREHLPNPPFTPEGS